MLSSKMCLLALCGNDISVQVLLMDDLLMDYFYSPLLPSRQSPWSPVWSCDLNPERALMVKASGHMSGAAMWEASGHMSGAAMWEGSGHMSGAAMWEGSGHMSGAAMCKGSNWCSSKALLQEWRRKETRKFRS